MPKTKLVCCSFCGKSQAEVRTIIAGPDSIYICDCCVGVCSAIIDRARGGAKSPLPPVLAKNANDAERVLFMLRELKKDEIITEAEYRAKARLLVDFKQPAAEQQAFPTRKRRSPKGPTAAKKSKVR